MPVVDEYVDSSSFPSALPGQIFPPSLNWKKKLISYEATTSVARARGINSHYADGFDYSIYDALSQKFPVRPRGGILFKTPFKLVNHHSSCSECHYSFELDTYGRGCTFNCNYCYAKEQLTKHAFWNAPQPFPIDISSVRKTFHTVFETSKKNRWREIIEKRIPLRIGSMSDAFMGMDKKYRVTFELLKILKFYRYPYIVFTRSDLIAEDDYLNLIEPQLAAVQFSICGTDPTLTSRIEPGAPSNDRRFRALSRLSERGVWTAIRINPLFPKYPDGYFTDRASVFARFGPSGVPTFPFFDIDNADFFLDVAAKAGVKNIIAGFVRLSVNAIAQMRKSTGVDLRFFFKPEILSTSSDRHFSDNEVTFYYKKLQSAAAKMGLRFSTCYIGNGVKDYYRHQDMWSNVRDCCDAQSNVPAFKTTSQSIPWSERLRHSPNQKKAQANQRSEVDDVKKHDEILSTGGPV